MIFVQFHNNDKYSTLLCQFITVDILEALEKELEKPGTIILQLES